MKNVNTPEVIDYHTTCIATFRCDFLLRIVHCYAKEEKYGQIVSSLCYFNIS